MNYPFECNLHIPNFFNEEEIKITLFSGLTTFVGPNGSGKTQVVKSLRNFLKQNNSVRYLSSNRIGNLEVYRSKTSGNSYFVNNFNLGGENEKKHRHEIETANGDFFTMDEKKDVYIKISERLSILFNRQVYIRWDSGYMKVFFEKINNGKEYPVVYEASGLINIISILAALFDDEVDVLIIDEPEVSLHPQLQSYLLREMKKAIDNYGKTIIITTHSTEMISFNSVTDLSNIVFFNEDEKPIQVSPENPILKNKKLKEFIMTMGYSYKNGLFAKKILLIEGISDLTICKFISNKLDLCIDVAGSQIIPVDGKGEFPSITKFFRLIGKEVCILTDLDGFIDDNDIVNLFSELPKAKILANKNGFSDIKDSVNRIKTDISKLIASDKENLKSIYENHIYWIHKNENEDTILKRCIIGQLFIQNNTELENWPNSDIWKGIKDRLEFVFSMLEEVGCFILKKGAIESYYSNTDYDKKTVAANEEISTLENKSKERINAQYEDVIKALKYASLAKDIDESMIVKTELLSELAVILEILPKISSEKEIYSKIKSIKNTKESLFDYKYIKEDNNIGVKVDIKSKIIDISGFPFEIYVGQNVNQIVNEKIKFKKY